MSTSRDESSHPDIVQKLLKLVLVLAAAWFVYDFLYPIVAGMYSSSMDSRLQQDFKEINAALDRREVRGQPYFDSDISKLQGEDLQEVPRDPWGKPYIYDVMFARIVSSGPNGELESYVAGISDPTLPAKGGDDQVFERHKLSQIVTAIKDKDSPKSKIVAIPIDGGEPETLAEVDGDVVGVHTQSVDKGVVIALRQGGKTVLMERLGTGPFKPVSSGTSDESNPFWYSAASDVVLFEGAASAGGPRQIFKTDPGSPTPAKLSSGSGDEMEPAVDGNKTIFFAARQGSNTEIRSFSFTQREPKTVVAKPGSDLRCPSPDAHGEQVAYLVSDGGAWALEVKDLTTGKITPVDKPVTKGTLIAWAPGSDKLAYMSPTEDGSGNRLTLYHLKAKLKGYPAIPPPVGRFGWVKP